MTIHEAFSGDEFEKAKCVIERWDPGVGDLARLRHYKRQREAERLCEGCPLMAQCATMAIELGSTGTVWGGTWIPEHVYGKDQSWLHRLSLVQILNRIPSDEEVQTRIDNDVPLPRYIMNRISSDAGRTIPLDEKILNPVEVCRKGHRLTPDNIYTPPSRPRVRECRKCIKIRHTQRRSQGKR